ncbi:MAG: hypothetical protein K6F99_04600 [Lachnospiraceae bacterium]|nr:hypothetical protein [Lachnospiraceae bacterium]
MAPWGSMVLFLRNDEKPGKSVRELGLIADKRMYEAKSAHYRKTGVDRRGHCRTVT